MFFKKVKKWTKINVQNEKIRVRLLAIFFIMQKIQRTFQKLCGTFRKKGPPFGPPGDGLLLKINVTNNGNIIFLKLNICICNEKQFIQTWRAYQHKS
jgi:hypothetical protein